ncbi:MAG: hypothetical protein MUP82_09780, partial [Candidatus Marinimicrobia bacterium]|nr:hypothetical protein [Candidatus Neomarinimicrobiota bacterium]
MTKVNTPKIDRNLLYRRQYFIGPQFVDRFKSWNRIKIGKNIHVTAHPDLTVTIAKKGDTELALLGFMFDSQNYQSDHKTILNEIISNNSEFADVIKATSRYAGRWIMIYSNNSESKLFHDPAGLRQVFYSQVDTETWCSAQPHILAEILDKKKNISKYLYEFLNSKAFELNERCMIGVESLYKDIYHLLPNHDLDLLDCSSTRYWPNEKIKKLSIDEAIDQSSQILIELIKAANHRYKIAQIITAGWDTRVLLAASRSFKNKNYYFVQQLPHMDDNHEDIAIPKQIASNNNLNFNVIDCSKYNNEFDKINTKNVFMVQSDRKKLQYFNYFTKFGNKMIISGNISPLIKVLHPQVDKVTAKNLARLLHFHNSKYAVKAISKWLEQSNGYSKKYNINIEKLFYWEMRFGTWAPMFNSELDIAVEEFSPYNCRNLLNVMLSTPVELRSSPNQILYSKIIHKLWPELLELPINPNSYNNPMNKKNKIINGTMRLLKIIGLYKVARFFYRKL